MVHNLVVGVQAPDRTTLLKAIDETLRPPIDFYLFCLLPCGEERTYKAREDVPENNDECHCGKLTYRHFFISYAGRSLENR